MHYKLLLMNLLLIAICFCACKKEGNSMDNCFHTSPDSRKIVNSPATIKSAGVNFYIVEQYSIDTKLNPCNLSPAFQISNLQVTISGDVKLTVQSGSGPCCIENFVISKITQ